MDPLTDTHGLPSGHSVGVTGASDDRTFVLDAVPTPTSPVALMMPGTHAWYLLTLAPGAARPRLAKLAIPATSNEIEGIALSPDGTKLAVLYQLGQGPNATGPIALDIYSVATGALLHSWTGTDPYHGSYSYSLQSPPDNNRNLSWTADGTKLAFAYRSSTSPDNSLYLRMVNLASPGTSLFTDSKVILKIGKSAIWCNTLGITADGQAAACGELAAHDRPGRGSTMEVWDPSIKGNLSYSHAWATVAAVPVPSGTHTITTG